MERRAEQLQPGTCDRDARGSMHARCWDALECITGTLCYWSAATGRAARTFRDKVVDDADVMLVGRGGTVLSRVDRDPSRPGQGYRRRWRRRGRGPVF